MPDPCPLVVVDFPGANGGSARLSFAHPIEVVVAARLDDVLPALRRVEQRTLEGRWAAGFVAYDAAPAFDPALRSAAPAPTPLLWFGIFDEPRRQPEVLAPERDDALTGPWNAHVDRRTYESAVEEIRAGIAAGAFYQVNHTVRLRAHAPASRPSPSEGVAGCLAAYEWLRRAQPDGYGMYVDTGRFGILSVSPELFFDRTGPRIRTRPMKGTARRGRWSEEDSDAAAALAASSKDRAENIMIVDLIRSDLGRIAAVGSVSVPHLFEVERHPTLWQMTSTITATLRPDVGLPAIFSALFPCGSVVGAPKIAAAAWIAEHEAAPRGVYCGAMGVVRPGGDCTFNVAIRTAVVDREVGASVYGAGGAITIDSTPAGEYDEILAKAAVLAGSPPPFELLETLRLVDGVYRRRSRHLRRLVASADYFGFAPVVDAANAALDALARVTPSGHHRVRLLLRPDGVARTESSPLPHAGAVSPPMMCMLARSPVSSTDPFLFHKTTRREIYQRLRAECDDVDEVILWNERGRLTECTIGNLVADLDGIRATPPRTDGLLAGVLREELLESGAIVEQELTRDDLGRASALWLINSVREWVPLLLR